MRDCLNEDQIGNQIKQSIFEYYNHIHDGGFSRELSWEHCYVAFCKARDDGDSAWAQLALHLAMCLASWGMYRGSSFLLQTDYKVHIKAVNILLKEKYRDLQGVSISEDFSKSIVDRIFSLKGELEDYYSSIRNNIYQNVKSSISPILISKIMLGALGCVPAYDEYFIKGLKMCDIAPRNFSKESLQAIASFYLEHIQSFGNENIIYICNDNTTPYPPMIIMDMGFWQLAHTKTHSHGCIKNI